MTLHGIFFLECEIEVKSCYIDVRKGSQQGRNFHKGKHEDFLTQKLGHLLVLLLQWHLSSFTLFQQWIKRIHVLIDFRADVDLLILDKLHVRLQLNLFNFIEIVDCLVDIRRSCWLIIWWWLLLLIWLRSRRACCSNFQ